MADREPTRADILAFMDDDERADWDAGKGTPEERTATLESLTALWRSIPDPTEEQLKPPFSHPDEWPPESSSANRDAVIDFNRQRWKKLRKVEAREELKKRKVGEHPPATTAEPLEAPFDLSRFDPSSLNLSHLHPAERDRILRREFYPQEIALLLDRKNPWTESGKPKPLPPTSRGVRVPAQTADNSQTPEEQRRNELEKFMPKQLRAEYDKADEKRKAALWKANERNFEDAREREERRLRQYQEKTEKTLDLLHRIQEDPNKADLLPPEDASMDDLHKWHDEMSKPKRIVPFPGEGGRADEDKATPGAKPDPEPLYGPRHAPEGKVIPTTRESPSFASFPVPREETIGYRLDQTLKENVAEAERLAASSRPKGEASVADRRDTEEPLPNRQKLDPNFLRRTGAEVVKHKGWYIFAFIAWGLPIGLAAIWPMLVRDQTLQEWLAANGWPRLTTLVIGWLAGLCVIALVIVARASMRAYAPVSRTPDVMTTAPIDTILLNEVRSEWGKLTDAQKALLKRILVSGGLNWNQIDDNYWKELPLYADWQLSDYLLERSTLLEHRSKGNADLRRYIDSRKTGKIDILLGVRTWKVKSSFKAALEHVIREDDQVMRS